MTLAQLLATPSREQLETAVLAYLQANGFPVTDWEPGGVERTRGAAWLTALTDFAAKFLPQVAAGGFVDEAAGPWLQLLAAQRFGTTFQEATRTLGTIRFINASTTPYTIPAGQLIIQFPVSGNRYTNVSTAVLAASNSTLVAMQSEFPVSIARGLTYSDGISTLTTAVNLVAALPGITAETAGKNASTVAHAGTGTGTIAITVGSPPPASHYFVVRVDTSGQTTAGGWSYSLDGAAFVSMGTIGVEVIGTSPTTTITPTNGGANPSFVAGDIYQFSTPGSWIDQLGRDVESDEALAGRCRARWPSLAGVPTLGFYDSLARAASNQVVFTQVVKDPFIVNKVGVYVAGQGLRLPIATLQAVQTYLDARSPETDFPVVLSPAPVGTTFSGSIVFDSKKTDAATVKANTETALQTYVASLGVSPTIRYSEVIRVITELPNVLYIDFATLFLLNGAATDQVVADSTGSPAVVDFSIGTPFSGLSYKGV